MSIPIIFIVARSFQDAGIPVDGISIKDPTDRTTWRADYSPTATPAQIAQGNSLLLTVDTSDATLLSEVRADFSTTRMGDDATRAIVQGLWEAIPAPTVTLAQLRTRIVTIYRGLL